MINGKIIAIDARMIEMSGIGTYIQHLMNQGIYDYALGNEEIIRKYDEKVKVIPYLAPIYSIKEHFAFPKKQIKEAQITVLNTGESPMFFYLGGHPAFNCPIDKGSFTDYEVVFEKVENLKHQNGNSVDNVSDSRIVSLSRALFDNDAIILDHPNSKTITLRSNISEHSVTVDFSDSDAIAIWSPKGDDRASFVCLEPWTSVPVDFDNDEEELEKKKHAIKLEAGKVYHYCYRILVE